jgi:Tfp pilus assembly protein PilV
MNRKSTHNRRSGFTLVEVLITGVLVAIALTGVFGGIRAITRADAQAKDADLLQRLAQEKVNDIKLLADPTDAANQGDFSDRGYTDITWNMSLTTTTITNLDQITVTAARGNMSESLTTQVYVAPVTTTTTTTSAGAGQ